MTVVLASAFLATGSAPGQSAGIEPFPASDMEAAQGLVGQMRALSGTISSRPVPRAAAEDAAAFELMRCGPWGASCADLFATTALSPGYSNDTSPIGTGFKALGPAGKTGTVDGPGIQGNGVYRVVSNDAYRLQIVVQTGYISGEITLVRDPDSGHTTMRFAGYRWDKKKKAWGPQEDKTQDVVVEYNEKKDLGYMRWVEDGQWKSERYYDGRKGTSMTIEFGGGWGHDFYQDK